MIIKLEYPPNYAEIEAAFDLKGSKPIFAFEPYIYNPHGIEIDGMLMVHEAVHGVRQGKDPLFWWQNYILDQAFRLNEEVIAHAAEYQWQAERAKDRAERRHIFHCTAVRLRHPIYGYKPSLPHDRARQLLKAGCRDA